MVSDSGSNHGVDAIFGPIDSLPCSEILWFSHNRYVGGQLTFLFYNLQQLPVVAASF